MLGSGLAVHLLTWQTPSLLTLIVGKYTFLSLFLAVTLEAFDTSDEGPPPTGFPPEAKKLTGRMSRGQR